MLDYERILDLNEVRGMSDEVRDTKSEVRSRKSEISIQKQSTLISDMQNSVLLYFRIVL